MVLASMEISKLSILTYFDISVDVPVSFDFIEALSQESMAVQTFKRVL